ncbi:MAG: hypothetical protein ACI8UD_000997 [Planctomycetota bacterium]|jgi:hypothetical protein
MALQVVAGAMLQCSFGVAPSSLVVLPKNKTLCTGPPAATIMDNIPMMNIMPFGMCSSPANPQVIAATAAALGVPTPMPCIPVIPAPWMPGATTMLIANQPALNNSSKCMCAWAGVISINFAGQTVTTIPDA